MLISLKISLKFLSDILINNILALVPRIAWYRTGEWWLFNWRKYASLGLNESIYDEMSDKKQNCNIYLIIRGTQNACSHISYI